MAQVNIDTVAYRHPDHIHVQMMDHLGLETA